MAVAVAPGTASTPTPSNQAPGMVIPFRKATLRKRTLMGNLVGISQGGANQIGGQSNFELDSKGFLGGIRLLVSGTAVVSTADVGTLAADWPWNWINRIQSRDSAGGMLHNLKGYNTYLVQRYFQAVVGRDLASAGLFNAGAAVDARAFNATLTPGHAPTTYNINWAYDLPVETDQVNQLGAVPNQNAAFRYNVQINYESTLANLYTVGTSSTVFNMTVQPSYRYYTAPPPVNIAGVQQQTAPPYPGVVRQIFDETQPIPSAAENKYPFQVGHVIRNFILVTRDVSGIRVGNSGATGITRVKIMYGDDTILMDTTLQDWITEHYEMYGETPPTGVYPFPFMRDLSGIVGQTANRDVLDTRNLSQFYLLVTTASGVNLDIVHDELIVPAGMSI